MPKLPCNPFCWMRCRPYLLNKSVVLTLIQSHWEEESLNFFICSYQATQGCCLWTDWEQSGTEHQPGPSCLLPADKNRLSPANGSKQAQEQNMFILVMQHHSVFITCWNRCCFSYLIIHDDLVGHGVEQCGLCNEFLLGIFVFLFTCLLDIVSCQCV